MGRVSGDEVPSSRLAPATSWGFPPGTAVRAGWCWVLPMTELLRFCKRNQEAAGCWDGSSEMPREEQGLVLLG